MPYDLQPMRAPRAAGNVLRTFVALVENPASGALLADKLLSDAGITKLRAAPTHHPPAARPEVFDHGQPLATPDALVDLGELLAQLPRPPASGFIPESCVDFTAAYLEGRIDPVAVAEQVHRALSDSEQRDIPMRFLIAHNRQDLMRQAEASAERYRQGKPLGPFDGVPIAVKDELDMLPYPTTVGTRFLGTEPAAIDAEVARRLRAAGAVLIGKANMHEIGIGVTGLNPHHGSARNPFDPTRATGGSSSGSAAIVGAGIVPMAVGADGGGSIRIPAGLCGQLGIKATFGRVSEHGAAELCWSVAHVGPIACSARDLTLGYALMAGADSKDANSLLQPEPCFDDIGRNHLEGMRFGVFRPWFEDAQPAVVARCNDALDMLRDAGAQVVDVAIDELELMRVAHLISIVVEMTAAHLQHYREHKSDYGLDTRVSLALGRRLQGYDYVHAQRHRARLYHHLAEALEQVDAIVTPATGCTAPLLPTDALTTGESNLELIGEIMRFAFPANLSGLPAISLPVGYDDHGLPVGLQLMGRPWEEHRLLRVATALETRVQRRAPRVGYRYLD